MAITRKKIKTRLDALDAAPIEVEGARDDGTALAALLIALEEKGIITDASTAT